MNLEDYFEELDELDVRVRGTRVGIETVLSDYLELGLSAEEIAARYPTLALEQVFATLTYYCRNREVVDAYLRRHREAMQALRDEQERNLSPALQRLRALARGQRAA